MEACDLHFFSANIVTLVFVSDFQCTLEHGDWLRRVKGSGKLYMLHRILMWFDKVVEKDSDIMRMYFMI